MEEYSLNDIADNLLIINKQTIDILFSLENGSDCVALYVFYYKTAKWQKTMSIKATDEYIKKSLKWGIDRIKKAKNILKDNGLIKVTKKTDEKGIITGWYVELSYMVEKHIQNTQCPQVAESTSGFQETNACNNINEMLNNNNINANKESIINNTKEKTDEENIYDYYYKQAIKFDYAKRKSDPNGTTLTHIKKHLKEHSIEEIKMTIDRYFKVINDKDYFFNTYWSAEKFFKQGNTFNDFLEEGSKWINYKLFKEKQKSYNPYQKGEISRETKYPELDDVGYIR